MPNIVKVKEHSPSDDSVIYHQTSADIVDVNNDNNTLESSNTQGAIDELDEKVELRATTKSLNELSDVVDTKSVTATYNATILANGFEGNTAPYKQTIEVEGILETDNPIVGLATLSDNTLPALEQRDSWGSVNRITCSDGFITVYCYEDLPSVDIDIQIKVIR